MTYLPRIERGRTDTRLNATLIGDERYLLEEEEEEEEEGQNTDCSIMLSLP